MALFEARVVNFDIEDGTAPYTDAEGVGHFPVIKQGSTTVFRLRLTLPNGNPASVSSGYTFTGQLRSRERSDRIEATIAYTVVASDLIEGRIEASDSASMQSRRGRWDSEVEYDDGGGELHRDRFVEGTYKMDREVTR